jgi:DNA polymerase I
MAPRLYLIDSHGQLYASFYAIREMSSPRGEPTNAVYGFLATLMKILREEKPDYLAACFDMPGPTHRHEKFEDYKAHRKPMPDDLVGQCDRVREILALVGVPIIQASGYEADDCLATMADRGRAAGLDVVICSRDKDLEQLVGPGVTMLDTKSFERLDTEGIFKRRGVQPAQMREVLALMGDASDNIPGVPGIGEKTATRLVVQYGSVENLLAHADEIKGKMGETLRAHKEDALQSRDLVQLDATVPIDATLDDCRTGELKDRPGLVRLLRDLGFTRFVDELTVLSGGGSGGAGGAGTGSETAAIKTHIVSTPAELAKLAQALAAQPAFAFDTETTSLNHREAKIVGMSFAWADDEGYYVPLLGPEGDPRLPLDLVRETLGPVLTGTASGQEDGMLFNTSHDTAPARLLVGQNVKYDSLVCRTSGIQVGEPIFDTMVAAYLTNPGRRQNNLDALALEYFNFTKITTESLLGEKKKKRKKKDEATAAESSLIAEDADDEDGGERTMDQAPVARVAEYAVEDAVITWRLKVKLTQELEAKGLTALARDVEMPLVPVLESMEELGIAIDAGVLSDIAANLDTRLAKLEQEIYAAAGHEFLINSPQQLAVVLFEELGLAPHKRTAKGSRPSTDANVLEDLVNLHPLPRLVLEYRQLAKLKGTYVDALPQLVDPHTGRIHTSFNQTVTATGRLSSSDPNLQNIPIRTEEGRQIRRAFVPGRADEVLLAADYSQIELRMLAHYTDDPALVRAFAEDRDIHTFVAHQIFNVAEADVTDEQRRRAKIVNFSLIYGKTAYGLARDLSIGVGEAEQFIDEYFDRYRGVRDFTRRVLEDAKRDGFVTTILGRRREIGEIGAMDPKRLTFAERTAINTVIQGSAADLIKVAMNRIWRRARREGRPSRLLLQIHDELIFETPAADLAEEKTWIVDELENAMNLRVPLKVHVASGKNWMEAE